jgi:hypothetical protein
MKYDRRHRILMSGVELQLKSLAMPESFGVGQIQRYKGKRPLQHSSLRMEAGCGQLETIEGVRLRMNIDVKIRNQKTKAIW